MKNVLCVCGVREKAPTLECKVVLHLVPRHEMKELAWPCLLRDEESIGLQRPPFSNTPNGSTSIKA